MSRHCSVCHPGPHAVQGLPTDELSVQNGIMVTRATRYPVMVDPQGQGRTWIMHREEANQLKVTQLNDKMFRNHLEVSEGPKPQLCSSSCGPHPPQLGSAVCQALTDCIASWRGLYVLRPGQLCHATRQRLP